MDHRRRGVSEAFQWNDEKDDVRPFLKMLCITGAMKAKAADP
jgi:hypothetical protein